MASPRTVIRGESPLSLPVSLDYFSFTVPDGDVAAIVRECVAFLGIEKAEGRGRGLHGYSDSFDLAGLGLVAYGGSNQRGTVLVSINGQGCRRIASFGLVRAWAEPLQARITRLDIAADDHDGHSLRVSDAIKAWRDGAFTLGGRPPKARLVDDLGSGDGKTFYVGSREAGKLCRVYDKGAQLGDPASRWVRGEVELHAKDRVIPWDAVTQPARYLAGSFPFFSFLSLVQERIRTIKKATEITIEALRRWVKSAAGKSINALMEHYEGDLGVVVSSVRRDGLPARLMAWKVPRPEALCPA